MGKKMAGKTITFCELFAGIGGFRLGLEKVNYGLENIEYAHLSKEPEPKKRTQRGKRAVDKRPVQLRHRNKPSFRCVYANEFNKYATQIYERNYEKPDTRDIREVPATDIPDHDLLTAGFPCQSFSIAGKRGGFNDTRGTLFFEIARILQQKQPRLLLLENVKGLLSHDKGKTFGTILNTLDELGYDCQWQVLNSKDFGVPQNRERVFIVGHLRGTSRPEVFPIVGTNEKALEQLVGGSQGMRVYSDKVSTTIAGLAGGWGAKTGLYAIPVLTPDRPIKRQNGRRFKEDGEPSFTLTGQDKHGVFDGAKIRRLAPTECERLQGFPDGWTEGISDTQRYKCLGNAVTTNVITAIGKRLLSFS